MVVVPEVTSKPTEPARSGAVKPELNVQLFLRTIY